MLFTSDDTICTTHTRQIYLIQCVGLDKSLQLQGVKAPMKVAHLFFFAADVPLNPKLATQPAGAAAGVFTGSIKINKASILSIYNVHVA